jgi:hypothetical protein
MATTSPQLSDSQFEHLHSAHCESGVTAALARYAGIDLGEEMAFGIGSGIFFMHIPFVKMMEIPITSYRSYPGTIVKKTFKRLGLKLEEKTFSSSGNGMARLDHLLEDGHPVGAQVSVFWLPYLPKQFRFQFNAHHVIVLGRKGEDYLISDPVTEEPVTCSADNFTRARFAKGPLSPKGKIYRPSNKPGTVDIYGAVRAGLKDTCYKMLGIPVPLFGIRGIRFLANQVERWPGKFKDEAKARLYLGQVVRMQEEIGTGGAGFRFLYGAFLQKAADFPRLEFLSEASSMITKSGDTWREFAVVSAHVCRGKNGATYKDVSNVLRQCADIEEETFRFIQQHLSKT